MNVCMYVYVLIIIIITSWRLFVRDKSLVASLQAAHHSFDVLQFATRSATAADRGAMRGRGHVVATVR